MLIRHRALPDRSPRSSACEPVADGSHLLVTPRKTPTTFAGGLVVIWPADRDAKHHSSAPRRIPLGGLALASSRTVGGIRALLAARIRHTPCHPWRHAPPRRSNATFKLTPEIGPLSWRVEQRMVLNSRGREAVKAGREGRNTVVRCTPTRPEVQNYKFMLAVTLVLALFTSPFAHGWAARQTVASHLLSYHALRSCQSVEPGTPYFS